jgi:hypothetical protein
MSLTFFLQCLWYKHSRSFFTEKDLAPKDISVVNITLAITMTINVVYERGTMLSFRLVYDPNLGQDVILSDTPLSKVCRYYSFLQLLKLFASFLRVLYEFIGMAKLR